MISSADTYTIVFTDSGLGGLSIMADFYNSLNDKPINFNEVNIIFFNALQEAGNGYNRMASVDEKIKTFNAALETISKLHAPDKIAIACNTLSSIYPKTAFSKKANHTIEIISCGISQIKKHLEQFPGIPVFVLATPTTLASDAYKIESENIYYISGDNLASLIEFNFLMPQLKEKVVQMFEEIKKNLHNNTEFAIFLGCTHYAYITNLFREVSEEFGLHINNIIDPANRFNKILLDQIPLAITKPSKTNINLKIESQAQILQEEIDSISSMIKNKSTEITHLLVNYTRLPKTF